MWCSSSSSSFYNVNIIVKRDEVCYLCYGFKVSMLSQHVLCAITDLIHIEFLL